MKYCVYTQYQVPGILKILILVPVPGTGTELVYQYCTWYQVPGIRYTLWCGRSKYPGIYQYYYTVINKLILVFCPSCSVLFSRPHSFPDMTDAPKRSKSSSPSSSAAAAEPRQKKRRTSMSSTQQLTTLPLMLPKKSSENTVLVQLDNQELDMTGDAGTIGRLRIKDGRVELEMNGKKFQSKNKSKRRRMPKKSMTRREKNRPR